MTDAPAEEIAVIDAAYASAQGDRQAAREARARVAEGAVERAEVRRAAEAFPPDGDADTGARLEAIRAAMR